MFWATCSQVQRPRPSLLGPELFLRYPSRPLHVRSSIVPRRWQTTSKPSFSPNIPPLSPPFPSPAAAALYSPSARLPLALSPIPCRRHSLLARECPLFFLPPLPTPSSPPPLAAVAACAPPCTHAPTTLPRGLALQPLSHPPATLAFNGPHSRFPADPQPSFLADKDSKVFVAGHWILVLAEAHSWIRSDAAVMRASSLYPLPMPTLPLLSAPGPQSLHPLRSLSDPRKKAAAEAMRRRGRETPAPSMMLRPSSCGRCPSPPPGEAEPVTGAHQQKFHRTIVGTSISHALSPPLMVVVPLSSIYFWCSQCRCVEKVRC